MGCSGSVPATAERGKKENETDQVSSPNYPMQKKSTYSSTKESSQVTDEFSALDVTQPVSCQSLRNGRGRSSSRSSTCSNVRKSAQSFNLDEYDAASDDLRSKDARSNSALSLVQVTHSEGSSQSSSHHTQEQSNPLRAKSIDGTSGGDSEDDEMMVQVPQSDREVEGPGCSDSTVHDDDNDEEGTQKESSFLSQSQDREDSPLGCPPSSDSSPALENISRSLGSGRLKRSFDSPGTDINKPEESKSSKKNKKHSKSIDSGEVIASPQPSVSKRVSVQDPRNLKDNRPPARDSPTSSLFLVMPSDPPPLLLSKETKIKRGSSFAQVKEGVMGKVSTTGDAKTHSSLSSVQSMWYHMSDETEEDFVRMNTHIEALLAYELAVQKATAVMASSGGRGIQGMSVPPQHGPTLADMHISTFTADEGDINIADVECPNIELLLTFASDDQKDGWFMAGGLMEALPHRNRRLVRQWFVELGTEIQPVKVQGPPSTQPGNTVGGDGGGNPPSNSVFSVQSGVLSSHGSGDNMDQYDDGNGVVFVPSSMNESTSLRDPNMELRVTAKNLYLNDKLLKQLESRLTRRSRRLANGSSHTGRSGTTSSSYGSESPSLGGSLRGATAFDTETGSVISDVTELEEERVHIDLVNKRQRIVEGACDAMSASAYLGEDGEEVLVSAIEVPAVLRNASY